MHPAPTDPPSPDPSATPLVPAPGPPITIAALLSGLEACSRDRPDRVLRLRGLLPAAEGGDPFELLIFRGFSSLTTHPTDFDPDRPALPEASRISGAELLQAPLDPGDARPLVGPCQAERFLEASAWG